MHVVGAVLTGGASRRMGRDKAFVLVDGTAMARRVADALAAGGCSRVLAIGGDAVGLAGLGLEVVADHWPGEGPLGAILTALESVNAPVFVAATDLARLDPSTVRAMIAAASSTEADAVVARSDRLEPLCAIWLPSAVAGLHVAFDSGERSVRVGLAAIAFATQDVEPATVRNVNRPEDVLGPGPAP